MKENLNINVQPKNATKIGKKVCVVEMKTPEDKQNVMENKSKLKRMVDYKVYINDDLTSYEREKQKIIRTKAQEERSKGREVKVGYSKLVVDGNIWRWDRSVNKMVELNPKN